MVRLLVGCKKMLFVIFLNIIATVLWSNFLSRNMLSVLAVEKNQIPVTIVMYHSILNDSSRYGTYVIPPELLENDIKFLVDNGYNFITLTDLINYVTKWWARLPDKPVMITFDDGYYNNYLLAYPILKKYDACFVLSVLGKYTDINKDGDKLSKYYSHVTWDQLKEMDRSGLADLQNHSYDLHTTANGRSGSLKKYNESLDEYKEFLIGDLLRLQRLFKRYVGYEPRAFTYPFGKISPESVEILKDIGFEAALTCYGGINYVSKGDEDILFKLKRYNRPYGESSESYFADKLAK